ncbi:hypothetical protein [Alkalihalobacillus sp. TS-13]|uniref:hypothetical protein n=1 Tax=Alkalihalobacillus sp. TS-13 TaxID=2842455 RepID=UPI001C880B8D|nr:hypothetical protein [Alkalihalobacillus sp. TS-13]
MSVTFFATNGPIIGYRVTCHCPVVAEKAEILETYQKALKALEPIGPRSKNETPLEGCEEPEFCLYVGAHIKIITENPMP